MEELCMILLFAAIMAAGYLAMGKLDVFLEEHFSMFNKYASQSRQEIRIGAETPEQLKDISSALQFCSDAFPFIDFSCKCDTEPQILHKLEDQKLDIAILANVCEGDVPDGYRSVHVIYQNAPHKALHGIHAEEQHAEEDLLVVWDPAVLSRNRDRVLLMLENQSRLEAVV